MFLFGATGRCRQIVKIKRCFLQRGQRFPTQVLAPGYAELGMLCFSPPSYSVTDSGHILSKIISILEIVCCGKCYCAL